MFDIKRKAMTYAELLVVLGVLGFIASLTLPALTKYSQRVDYGRQAQKAYITLDAAIDASTFEHGFPEKWTFTQENFFDDYINAYIKHKKSDPETSIDGMKYSLYSCTATQCLIEADICPETEDDRRLFCFALRKIVNGNETNVALVPVGVAADLKNNQWNYTAELWNNTSSSGCDQE